MWLSWYNARLPCTKHGFQPWHTQMVWRCAPAIPETEVGAGRPEVQSRLQQHSKLQTSFRGFREAPLGGVAAGRIVCMDLKKHNLWVRVKQMSWRQLLPEG